MCDACKKDYGPIEITLTDKIRKQVFCPNCLCEAVMTDLRLENDESLICDVTEKAGAVSFESLGEKYVLDKDIMVRLIRRNLTPDEWLSLSQQYGENQYMLHDDFYDPVSGEAYQPIE